MPGLKRLKRSHETKRKIFTAAMQLFRQYSFEEVTIKDICEDAGVSISTLYHYFPSKEHILLDVSNAIYFEPPLKNLTGSSLDNFNNLIQEYIKFLSADGPELSQQTITATMKYNELGAFDPSRSFIAILTDIIRTGCATGEFRPDVDAQLYAKHIHYVIVGVMVHFCASDGKMDLAEETRNFISTARSFLMPLHAAL